MEKLNFPAYDFKLKKNNNKIEVEEEIDKKCEECNKTDDSVLQNLIITGFKICSSCRTSKTIFPI